MVDNRFWNRLSEEPERIRGGIPLHDLSRPGNLAEGAG